MGLILGLLKNKAHRPHSYLGYKSPNKYGSQRVNIIDSHAQFPNPYRVNGYDRLLYH